MDLCEPNPCQNAGKCQAFGNTHVCTCPRDFTGDDCTAKKAESEIVYLNVNKGLYDLYKLVYSATLLCESAMCFPIALVDSLYMP